MRSIFPKIQLCIWDYIGILICSVPAFYLLGHPAIYIFDEAVYANASWNMAHGSSWLIPVNPMYNTKPPLVLWMQAISLKIFPWPEFAIRFPSAISVTGILLLMTHALKRWGFQLWARILVMVCFIGHEGFIRHHISRTGDLDAVMSLFVVGYILVALDSIHNQRWTHKHIMWFFILVIAAFYAKSIAGWMMLGPLLIVWLLSPMRSVLFSKEFLLGSFASILICISYYFMRESLQPGYLFLTFHSEYLRMFSNVMPWHEHGFGYYFKNFVSLHTYTPWVYFLAAAMLYCLFFLKDLKMKPHLMRWMILSMGYMLLISIPADKLEWYDAPAFPFFAMITGVVAGYLTLGVPGRLKFLWFIPISFIFWRKIDFISKDILPRHPFENEGYMLRDATISGGIKVLMPVEQPEHQLQLNFYSKIKSVQGQEKGSVEVISTVDQVNVGDQIIISKTENLKMIQDKFLIDTLKAWPGIGYEIFIKKVKREE